ncbi:MAG: hypothetical protein LBJ08_10560, partial [Bifidobacteriaceae bacterium]|nr:hypothetical protein [Bifidobacteriaceae bacterium]
MTRSSATFSAASQADYLFQDAIAAWGRRALVDLSAHTALVGSGAVPRRLPTSARALSDQLAADLRPHRDPHPAGSGRL